MLCVFGVEQSLGVERSSGGRQTVPGALRRVDAFPWVATRAVILQIEINHSAYIGFTDGVDGQLQGRIDLRPRPHAWCSWQKFKIKAMIDKNEAS